MGESRVALGEYREGIVGLLETASGERERAVDSLDRFDRLVDSIGDGDIVVGWYGSGLESAFSNDTQPLPGGLGPDENVITAARFVPGGNEITVELTVQDDSLSPDRHETLKRAFGGGETSASLEDGRFSANKTYDEIPFEPTGTDPTDDLPSGDDLPTKISEAVPDGSIEINSTSEDSRYWVEVRESVQVDELTVRAIEADRQFTVFGPDIAGRYRAFVDRDGDEIRVVATVDDVSGIVATKSVP
ncbi:MAG: hypothetical protein J07HX64_02443 [halophilic archaeon J07HX64]|nr:MAG: hypothetical protein J07HX64_02443 [halophilic archaeon J07HX64]